MCEKIKEVGKMDRKIVLKERKDKCSNVEKENERIVLLNKKKGGNEEEEKEKQQKKQA